MRLASSILALSIFLLIFIVPTQGHYLGQAVQEQSAQKAISDQERFIQNSNRRIEDIIYREELKRWKELEELQEFEALRQLAKSRELNSTERNRLAILKKKQESLLNTQVVSTGDEQKAIKLFFDSKAQESYQALYDAWKKRPTEELLIQLAGAITLVALRKEINSTVKISSSTPGATIKYQTLFERSKNLEPMTAKQLTRCIETMPIGYYYIWSERDGKATSDKESKVYISAPEEEVTVAEKKP